MGSVSLVIEVSKFNENPLPAYKSGVGIFDDIHIVCHGGVYNFPNVTYHSNGVFDPTKAKHMAIIRVTADTRFDKTAVERITQDMQVYADSCEHYAISSTTTLDYPTLSGSFWYGFLLIILYLDTIRSILQGFQYQRTCDMRASFLHKSYPNRIYEATPPRLRWLIFTRMFRTRPSQMTCAQYPEDEDQGFHFVWRTIYTHQNMKLYGLPWIFGFVIHYYFYSLIFFGPSVYLIPLYVIHYLIVGYLAHQHLIVPYWWMLVLQIILYPVYLTVFPMVYLFLRIIPPRVINKLKK